jgi:hypothetical protein
MMISGKYTVGNYHTLNPAVNKGSSELLRPGFLKGNMSSSLSKNETRVGATAAPRL